MHRQPRCGRWPDGVRLAGRSWRCAASRWRSGMLQRAAAVRWA